MKRIMVIGNCGVGKSTFSTKLNHSTNIDLIHLDSYYWKANWVESKNDEWLTKVEKLANRPSWIIDGNYGGTMDIRINRADTIIFLDYPTRKALWRVIKRIYKYWGKTRPDMPENCNERFDLHFIIYVALFNFKRKRNILNKLSLQKGKKNIFIFQNDKQVT